MIKARIYKNWPPMNQNCVPMRGIILGSTALPRLWLLLSPLLGILAMTSKSGKVRELGVIYADESNLDAILAEEEALKAEMELMEEKRNRKDLIKTDHSKIDYQPFRKNLYILPKTLAKLNDKEVADLRSSENIKVRGKGCPPPISKWSQCGLSERILSLLEKNKLETPFAIQKQAIPAIMGGRDVIGVAKTGSGKTLAFILPLLRHIQDQPPLANGDGPIALIMAPARELAYQIRNEARKFTKALNLSVVCCYGGAGIGEQIADLKRGAEIVVCTPGRMIDLLSLQNGRVVNLRRVTIVVMDEADRMFDMGFEPQIKMITDNTRPDRQTILFSATFPKPIEKLARSALKFPLEIQVGNRIGVNTDIAQSIEVHDDNQKYLRLLQLLGIYYEKGNVLIFVERQEKCDELFKDLLTAGYACVSLHGGKDQIDRDHVLTEFKQLIKPVMIATGVAGRGLDVPEIVCVINYHCPNHLEDYIHRVGRTGRAGRKGNAYTFIGKDEEQYSSMCIEVLETCDKKPSAALLAMQEEYAGKDKADRRRRVNGFVGKGYKFDDTEMSKTQQIAAEQQMKYTAETGEEVAIGKGSAKAVAAAAAAAAAEAATNAVDVDDDSQQQQQVKLMTDPVAAMERDYLAPLAEALERANRLISSNELNHLSLPPSTTLEQGAMRELPIPSPCVTETGSIDRERAMRTAELVAAQIYELKLQGTLSSMRSVQQVDLDTHFATMIYINDYPMLARRKVTTKVYMDEITERTGVAFIARGSHLPAASPENKKSADEAAKYVDVRSKRKGDLTLVEIEGLHLIIEGDNANQVRQARAEVMMVINAEVAKAGSSSNQPVQGTRYQVV